MASMDWKDILAGKVSDGTLEREEFVAEEKGSSARVADTLHVTVDRKGRKGKTATIIDGFTCPEQELCDIAARLKSRLGTGGSARGGEILIQGECADKVRALLAEMGYKVR